MTWGTYTSYKESGIEWLEKIPEHWEIKKLKHALQFTTGGTPSSGVEDYYNGEEPWVTIADMTGKYIEKSHFISKKAIRECNMQIVPKDSLLYSFKLSVGQVAFTTQNTYTNEAIASFYPANNIDLNFWYYVLPVYVIRNANKNIYGAYLLNQDLIKNATIIFPPKKEQIKIASFLDEKTTQIDEVIRQKEKLIELLKERKQIVINEAVTKGLDKTAEFKESGVEWIGKIPKHWEIVSNRIIFKEKNERGNKELPIFMVSIHSAVSSEEISEEENIRGKIRIEDKSQYKMVDRNDIVFNMMRAWQGAIGAVKATGLVSPAYIVATANESINTIYFEYLYRTSVFIQQMDQHSKGITDFRKRLYWSEFKQLLTVLPPKDEQLQIIMYIDEQTANIDRAIDLQQNYIAKLKEYKATLIDSVVTGKVRVAS